MRALWKRFVVDVRARADAEVRPEADARAIVVLLTATACLVLIRFIGMPYEAGRLAAMLDAIGLERLGAGLLDSLTTSPDARIHRNVYWSMWRVFGYILVPTLIAVSCLKIPLSQLGLRISAGRTYGRIYVVLLALILPFVVLASFSPEFQASYPFYEIQDGEPLWPVFWTWEVLYALQFVGLEFFFRGFVLHGLLPRFGYLSIFVMMVPYTMIHFQKPALEAVGSIVAGFALGTLALESRSIWWGAFAHVSVALSMDFLSLWHRGFF